MSDRKGFLYRSGRFVGIVVRNGDWSCTYDLPEPKRGEKLPPLPIDPIQLGWLFGPHRKRVAPYWYEQLFLHRWWFPWRIRIAAWLGGLEKAEKLRLKLYGDAPKYKIDVLSSTWRTTSLVQDGVWPRPYTYRFLRRCRRFFRARG